MGVEEFFDTKVIEIRRLQEQLDFNSIETGIYVNNHLVEFEVIEVFDNKMSIALPSGMTIMPDQLAKFKYPSEQRPQLIYSNEDGSVNFTFSHFDLPIEPEETLLAVEQFKSVIKKVHPANIFYETKEEMVEHTKLSWFDFKGYAVDNQTYNLVYVTPIDKTVLHGTFNCLFGDAAEWKKAVLPAILSIKDLTVKKGAERS